MGGSRWEMEASVLPKDTDDLPTVPVFPVTLWKHLLDLELADPDYKIPVGVYILLAGKVFNKEIFHGLKFGPTGAPSAYKTCFGWVLNSEANVDSRQRSSDTWGVQPPLTIILEEYTNDRYARQSPGTRRKLKECDVLASGTNRLIPM